MFPAKNLGWREGYTPVERSLIINKILIELTNIVFVQLSYFIALISSCSTYGLIVQPKFFEGTTSNNATDLSV